MRGLVFAKRCVKEVLRDPLTLLFGLGFPLVLLILLSVMQRNMPPEAQMELFQIETLLPGVSVFGFSFLALFGGQLLSADRESSFLVRLYTSPMRPAEFLAGYAVPLIPMGLIQALACILVALPFGLLLSVRVLIFAAVLVPAIVLFMALGLLCGSLLSTKQVGGLCGALLTNLSAWLSGTWFSLSLLGKGVERVAYCLPFANAVDAARYALAGEYGQIARPLLIVCAYAAVILAASVLVFRKKMRE